MYDTKKRLPGVEVDVLALVNFATHAEMCEGCLTEDGHWYLYKYGRNGWGDWNVVSWMPMPKEDHPGSRFLRVCMGYVIGVALALATLLLVG